MSARQECYHFKDVIEYVLDTFLVNAEARSWFLETLMAIKDTPVLLAQNLALLDRKTYVGQFSIGIRLKLKEAYRNKDKEAAISHLANAPYEFIETVPFQMRPVVSAHFVKTASRYLEAMTMCADKSHRQKVLDAKDQVYIANIESGRLEQDSVYFTILQSEEILSHEAVSWIPKQHIRSIQLRKKRTYELIELIELLMSNEDIPDALNLKHIFNKEIHWLRNIMSSKEVIELIEIPMNDKEIH